MNQFVSYFVEKWHCTYLFVLLELDECLNYQYVQVIYLNIGCITQYMYMRFLVWNNWVFVLCSFNLYF